MLETRNEIYGNIRFVNLDNNFLFYGNNDKATWYVKRRLAKFLSQDPPIVQLQFQTGGTGKHDDPYYDQIINNRCVVCGSESNLTSHHVVPYSYRKHIIPRYREYQHDTHDLLAICGTCHEMYEKRYSCKLRRKIASELDISLEGTAFASQPEIYTASQFARVLKKHRSKMPSSRTDELETFIQNALGHSPSDEDLDTLCQMKSWNGKGPGYKTHGELVVEKILQQEELVGFIRRWRHHFINTMKPKFLPKYWSPHKKLLRIHPGVLHTSKCTDLQHD